MTLILEDSAAPKENGRKQLISDVFQENIKVPLQLSEERMRLVLDASNIGFWDWNIVTGETAWSRTAGRQMGLPENSPRSFEIFMNSVHPDDRRAVQESIKRAVEDNKDYAIEYRVLWPDGSLHWRFAKGHALYDGTRHPLRMVGIVTDIDASKSADERLGLQAAALQAAANAIVITDNKGIVLWTNRAFSQLTGYAPEEVLGKNPRLWKSGEQDNAVYAHLWATITSGNTWQGQITNRRKDGGLYAEEMTVTPVRIGSCEITHYVAIKQDITSRRLTEDGLRRAERKYRSIFENAVLGIFQTTWDGKFLSVNPALARMAGYDSPEDFLNSLHCTAELYVDLKRREELRELIMAQKIVRDFEVEFRCKDGSKRTTSINIGAMPDGEETNIYLEGTVQDITERKAAEARIQFLAYHDSLTGLPNRVLFEDRLAKALGNARRRGERVAVLWLGLDNFKTINDSLGHSVGDLLLKQVGERLNRYTRAQDTVAKVGGDEFVFALINPGDVSRVVAAAERIRRSVTGEFEVQGHVLNVTCSIGISLFPDHGADSEALVKNAAVAMYCAKKNGRNNFQFFTSELNEMVEERLALESSLRVALEKRELFLVYQPQVEIATGRITGGEALLRWRHPGLGLIPAEKFIPVAENSGLIVPIGEWVLKTACAQARRWLDLGLPALPVAVNVSALQFRQQGFLKVVRRALDETGLAPQYLELEITESLMLSDAKKMLSTLQELARMGVLLSIDDFGTGYSSLSYLKDLPVYKLKIDHSFIQTMTVSPRNAGLTAAVISMGNCLDLKVLAEGVENEEQMSFLRTHNCDEIQGYYFSKPLDADEFSEKVRSTLVSQLVAPYTAPTPHSGAPQGQSPSCR